MIRGKLHRVPFWNDLAPLTYQHHWDNSAKPVLRNDGVGVHLKLQNYQHVPTIYGGPLTGTYELHRVYFYWGLDNASGAQHLIGDVPIAMEVHANYCNPNCKGSAQMKTYEAWAVVVTRFTEGPLNTNFQNIAHSVKAITCPYSSVVIKSDYLSWMKRPQMDRDYITYKGQQMKDQEITWIIYVDPIKVSKEQVNVFRTIVNRDEVKVKESLCTLPLFPVNKEIVVVKEISFVPIS